MILVPSGTCHASLSIGHSIFGVDNEGLANESGIYDIYMYIIIYSNYIYIHTHALMDYIMLVDLEQLLCFSQRCSSL